MWVVMICRRDAMDWECHLGSSTKEEAQRLADSVANGPFWRYHETLVRICQLEETREYTKGVIHSVTT